MANSASFKQLNVLPTQFARIIVQIVVAIALIIIANVPITGTYYQFSRDSIMPATHFLTWIDFGMIIDDITLVVPLIPMMNGLSTGRSSAVKGSTIKPTAAANKLVPKATAALGNSAANSGEIRPLRIITMSPNDREMAMALA